MHTECVCDRKYYTVRKEGTTQLLSTWWEFRTVSG